jgi:hypothetical protein
MEPSANASTVLPENSRAGLTRGAEGFFRVTQDPAHRWWLLDASGRRFFARAIHGVQRPGVAADGELPLDAGARLRRWDFNAVGVARDTELHEDGLPFLASAELSRAAPLLSAPGLRLPDVFDPEWPKRAAARAHEACAGLTASREMIGWVTDNHLEWAPPSAAGRPSLLQLCLSLEPSFAAYHAAWEFVLAHHGGRLESVASAWHADLPNKEVVRELTRAEEGLGTRGYLRDDARWTREFARRYFSAAAAAVRAADPNHLVLGPRFRAPPASAIVAECHYPAVDVSLFHWSELPQAGAKISQPILATDVNWTTEEFLHSILDRPTPRLTSIERMLRKARTALDRMARHPAVVGYVWASWQDEPGEQPPFASGVLHANGTEAREHTELLTQFNRRAEELHQSG